MSGREHTATGINPLEDVATSRTRLTKAEHIGHFLIGTLDSQHTLDVTGISEAIGIELELDGVVAQVYLLALIKDEVG